MAEQAMESAGHWTAGRAKAPRQSSRVSTDVPRAVLLEDVVRRSTIQKLLGAVVERLPPYYLSIWIDELHVFGICPLDGRPAGVRVAL